MNTTAPFSWSLLHPKYWGFWLGSAIMRVLILLPLSVQYRLGLALGKLLKIALGKRIHVARRNIELCLPELSEAEREALINQNFTETGMALFDTANAWWWSDKVQQHMTILGAEHLKDAEDAGQGVILIAPLLNVRARCPRVWPKQTGDRRLSPAQQPDDGIPAGQRPFALQQGFDP